MNNKEIQSKYLSEKKEYIGIDFFKFICSFLVVSIHTMPFGAVNAEFNFWFTQVFCRIAVPFFFMASGYFAALKIKSGKQVFLYIKRLVLLYLLYSCLYFPEEIYKYTTSGSPPLKDLIQQLLCTGINVVLWYFIALIISILLLYFFINKLKLRGRVVLPLAGVLYVIGCMGQAYYSLVSGIPVIGNIIEIFYKIYGTMENAFLFGFFFVALGYYIRVYAGKIKIRCYTIAIIGAFIIVSLEGILTKTYSLKEEHAMLITMPVLMLFVFLTVASVSISCKYIKVALLLRKMSVLIYGLHMLVDFYLLFFFNSVLSIPLWQEPLLHYLVLIMITSLIAFLLVKLSETKKFQWLKYLY